MTLDAARARHAQLAEEIRGHDHAYYVLATPSVSDREHDQLYRQMKCGEVWPKNLVSHA